MKSKIALTLTIVVALLSCLVVGCGVPQEQYDRINSELRASQSQAAELQSELRASQSQAGELQSELRASQSQAGELQNEIRELKDKYELLGETPTETAENIVKHYHETHLYSEYDFFVCSDMALDVWDMLKAQGINAIIQIGNVETDIQDITEANHAWVLAETSPGKYLALETTGGYAVRSNDNPLYYQGWSFDNPKEYKRCVELKQEFNIRVNLIKQYGATWDISNNAFLEAQSEYEQLANEYGGTSVLDPSFGSKLAELIVKALEAGKYSGKCEQLNELVNEESQKLINIASEMKGLSN